MSQGRINSSFCIHHSSFSSEPLSLHPQFRLEQLVDLLRQSLNINLRLRGGWVSSSLVILLSLNCGLWGTAPGISELHRLNKNFLFGAVQAGAVPLSRVNINQIPAPNFS